MLDRKQAPQNIPLQTVRLWQPRRIDLQGGATLYLLHGGEADLVRIEFIFPHTGWDPEQPLLNRALAGMLLEGTVSRTAAEIAETIDYYGAFLHAESSADHIIVTLHTLSKHIGHTLPIVKEVLGEAVFPENELAVYARNSLQKLQVSLEKNEFQARRAFNAAVFGTESPYGYPLEPEDFTRIDRDALLTQYPRQLSSKNCFIVASGKISKEVESEIMRCFNDWEGEEAPAYDPVLRTGAPGKYAVEMPGSVQSAIRIGKPLIHRTHPDYVELQILNTVLGGYFGSRLMANIREDKGYTYGIGSGLHSFKNTGLFFIATEVGVDVRENALREIYHEMERLTSEPVPQTELDLVRNYLMGSFLGSLENVFSHADKFKSLLLSGLDYAYYDRYFEAVRNVSAARLKELAIMYFAPGDFYEVTAG